MTISLVGIIDSDRKESSNWNETCLNNSLNVSSLAFQAISSSWLVHRGYSVSRGLRKGEKL